MRLPSHSAGGQDEGPALPSAEARLLVRVVARESGLALTGIPVSVRATGRGARAVQPARSLGELAEILETDAEGRVEFVVPAGQELELLSNPLGESKVETSFEPVNELDPGELRELELELATEPDLVWFGRVVDGETGAPLGGAEVARVEDTLHPEVVSATAVCDSNGLVRLAFASWEDSYAYATHPSYATGVAYLDHEHGQPSTPFVLLLHRAATLDVLVQSASGSPLAGLQLELTCDPFYRNQGTLIMDVRKQRYTWRSTTDERGRARVEGLPTNLPLTAQIFEGARVLRRQESSLQLEPGEERVLTWTVGGGCLVEGRTLEADGSPAPEVQVWLSSGDDPYFKDYAEGVVARTSSDASGRFTFAEVAAGSWLVGPAPVDSRKTQEATSPQAIAPVGTALEVLPDQDRASVTLTCWRGLFLRGTVVGPDEEPVKGAFLSAVGEGIVATGNARRGQFSIGPLPPGSYEVLASGHQNRFAPAEPVRARAGTDDLVLHLGRGASVWVHVLDSSGSPSSRTMVFFLEESGAEGSSLGIFTGPDGSVPFHGTAGGTYTISASTAAGEFAMTRGVRLASGSRAEQIELHLEPAARLKIVVVPELPQSVSAKLFMNGLPIGFALLDGDPLAVVPPGEIEVQLSRRGQGEDVLARRRVSTVLGQETLVTFELDAPR